MLGCVFVRGKMSVPYSLLPTFAYPVLDQ